MFGSFTLDVLTYWWIHKIRSVVTLSLSVILGATTIFADQPDVVLLMTDQQRYDELSILGTPGARTPSMDRICTAGVMFTQAFVPTPQCSPTRASIVTGRFPHRTGVPGNVSGNVVVPAGMSGPLDTSIPSLGSVFAAAGYQTAYFGKWHLGASPADHGFQTVGVSSGREISLHISDFLDRARRKENRPPLLLVVSWINPHDIYLINHADTVVRSDIETRLPDSLADDLAKKPYPHRHFLAADQGVPFANYTAEQWKRYVRYYHQLTTQVDVEIGRVVETIRAHAPSAITVFTSDHGDLGGAHRMPYKSPAMYDELIRVPLAISWPNKIKPTRSDALVSSIDLLPTLCDLAGIDIPRGVDGVSLGPLLKGQSAEEVGWRDAVFGEYFGKQSWRAPIRMVRTRRWKYTRYTKYGEELYDLESDPAEIKNLALDPTAQAEKERLITRLEAWMDRTDDPFDALRVTNRAGRELD
jgi:arylsulfatase A-like enzyme